MPANKFSRFTDIATTLAKADTQIAAFSLHSQPSSALFEQQLEKLVDSAHAFNKLAALLKGGKPATEASALHESIEGLISQQRAAFVTELDQMRGALVESGKLSQGEKMAHTLTDPETFKAQLAHNLSTKQLAGYAQDWKELAAKKGVEWSSSLQDDLAELRLQASQLERAHGVQRGAVQTFVQLDATTELFPALAKSAQHPQGRLTELLDADEFNRRFEARLTAEAQTNIELQKRLGAREAERLQRGRAH